MRKLVNFGVVVCLATFLGSGLWPETTISQSVRPTAAGDSVLSIPACAFTEREDDYDFIRGYELGFISGTGTFRSPVNLPSGSIIKKIILICTDNGSASVLMELYRVTQNGSATAIASVSSSGAVSGHRTFAQKLTSNKYVSTWKYSYYLTINLPGTISAGYYFSQAKIVYTPPSP